MRLNQNNKAIAAIRSNARMRDDLMEHLSGVRADELEILASSTRDHADMRFMQGRIAMLTDLIKVLDQ